MVKRVFPLQVWTVLVEPLMGESTYEWQPHFGGRGRLAMARAPGEAGKDVGELVFAAVKKNWDLADRIEYGNDGASRAVCLIRLGGGTYPSFAELRGRARVPLRRGERGWGG